MKFTILFLLAQAAWAAADTESNEELNKPYNHPSNKRGLGWHPDASKSNLFKTAVSGMSWWYNWNSDPWGLDKDTDAEYVHTQWGPDGVETIKDKLPNNAVLLGFNEPDHPSQSSMSAQQAADLYKQYLMPLADEKGIRLSTPGVSNAPQGLEWLKEFMGLCGDVSKIRILNLHWYGPTADSFKEYIEKAHEAYPDLPVWITEFGVTNWDASKTISEKDTQDFLEATTSFCDNTDWIERYAWFGAMDTLDPVLGDNNRLLNADNSLTALGKLYSRQS